MAPDSDERKLDAEEAPCRLPFSKHATRSSDYRKVLQLLVDNRLIIDNLAANRRKVLPLLGQNGLSHYYFAVSAVDDGGESAFSNELHVAIPPR